jgi:hypothetical protein
LIDVTCFLQSQLNRDVSFLVSQDPRWDVALPSLASGDTQVDGLEFVSTEGGTPSSPGPQLKLVRLKDDDGDGLSNEAETTIFFTNPALPDTDDDGQTDGEEWFAGTDPTNDVSRFTLSVAEVLNGDSIRMAWPSLEHRTYTIERSLSLTPFQWSAIHTVAGTGNTLDHTDTPGTTNAVYRLTVE